MSAGLALQLSTENLVQYTLNGLNRGMLIFLIAMGLTLIFEHIGLINFAHGALFTLGGYVTISVVNLTGSYWIAVLVAFLAVIAWAWNWNGRFSTGSTTASRCSGSSERRSLPTDCLSSRSASPSR